MTLNFPGPYEVRIYYTVTLGTTAIQHVQKLNVACSPDPTPGDAFADIDIVNGYAVVSDLQTEVAAWVNVLKALFNSGGVVFDYAELWKYTPGTFVASFISAETLAIAGTSGTGTVTASECIFTMRSREGGTMRVHLEEAVISQAAPRAYAAMSALEQAVVDKLLNPTTGNWFLARDSSYPFASNKLFPGQSEAIFKRRYGRT